MAGFRCNLAIGASLVAVVLLWLARGTHAAACAIADGPATFNPAFNEFRILEPNLMNSLCDLSTISGDASGDVGAPACSVFYMTCHGGPDCSPTGMGGDMDRVTELKIRDDDDSYMLYKNWNRGMVAYNMGERNDLFNVRADPVDGDIEQDIWFGQAVFDDCTDLLTTADQVSATIGIGLTFTFTGLSGDGFSTDMSERTLEAYATRIGWVALGGTCAEIEKIQSVAGLHPDHVSFTAGPFLSASTYSPCVSKDAGQTWYPLPVLSLTVVPAPSGVEYLANKWQPLGSVSIALQDLDTPIDLRGRDTFVSFVPATSTCPEAQAPRVAVANIPTSFVPPTLSVNIPAPGIYMGCISTDRGRGWSLLSGPTLEVFQPSTEMIRSAAPALVYDSPVTLTLDAVPFDYDAVVSLIKFQDSDCATERLESTEAPVESNYEWVVDLSGNPFGAFRFCVLSQGSYYLQDTALLLWYPPLDENIVTESIPSHIAPDTVPPYVDIKNAPYLSYLALTLDDDCGDVTNGVVVLGPTFSSDHMATAFPAGVSEGDVITVCLSYDDSVYVSQPLAEITVMSRSGIITGVSPSFGFIDTPADYYFAGLDDAFALTNLNEYDMNPRIGLSRQADNCATPGTFVMTTNGPITWQAPWAGTYYVCFGYTDDSGEDMYMDLGLSVVLYSKTPGLTTVATPTVYRGRPTAVDVSGIVSPSTAVFRASLGDSVALCDNPSFSVPLTWVPHPGSNDGLLVVDISPADTAIDNAPAITYVCYDASGQGVWSVTGIWMSVIGQVTAATISGGPPYVLDVFEGSPTVLLPLLFTNVVAGTYNDDYIAIARQGGCKTGGNGFRPIVGNNPREFDQVTAMAFGPFDASDVDMSVPYLTMALCYTRHLDDPFVEQDAYTIRLHWAHSRVVTAVEPSEFVSGSTMQLTSVTVGDAGTEDLVFDAGSGSYVVLGVSDSPTCSPMLGSAAVSETVSLGSPLSLGIVATNIPYLTVCLSTDGGSTFVPQTEVSIAVSTDSSASDVASVVPAVWAAGVTETLTIAFNVGPTVTSEVAFSLDGSCSAPVAVTAWGDASARPIAAPLAAGAYSVCYDPNGGSMWTKQLGVVVQVVDGAEDAVTFLSVAAVPINANFSLSLSGAVYTSTTTIDFSVTADCATDRAGLAVALQTDRTVYLATGFPAKGDYTVCYAVDGSTWFAQSDVDPIAALAAGANDATTVSPRVVGAESNALLTIVGVDFSDFTHVALVGPTGSCSIAGDRRNEAPYPSPDPILLNDPDLWAGSTVTWRLCVRIDAGFVEQTNAGIDVRVVVGSSTSLLAAPVPSLVGVQTAPSLTFADADFDTGTAGVAFGETDCAGLLFSEADFGNDAVVDLSSPLPNLGSSQFRVCYSVNTNVAIPTWHLQDNVVLDVVIVSPTDLVSLAPSVFGANTRPSVNFTGVVVLPTTLAAFARSAPECVQAGARVAEVSLASGASAVLPVGGVPDRGLYGVCLSVDAGQSWVFQTGPTATVVDAAPSDLTNLVPSQIGVGQGASFAVDGVVVTATSRLGFQATGGGCGSPVWITSAGASGAFTMPGPGLAVAGPYDLCYSTDGVTFVAQASVRLDVYAAVATAISDMQPRLLGAGLATTVSLTGYLPTPTAAVAFGRSGNCSASQRSGQAPYNLGINVTVTIPSTGQYSLCYAVDAASGNFVAQAAIDNVFAVAATPTAATAFGPPVIGVGTLPLLTLTTDSPRPEDTYLAFSNDGCVTVFGVTLIGTDDGAVLGGSLAAAAPGPASVCLSYSGPAAAGFVAQTNVADLLIIEATPVTVTAMEPSLIDIGTLAVFNLTGAQPSPTTRVAFALVGQCDVASNRFADTAVETDGMGGGSGGGSVVRVQLASVLAFDDVFLELDLCYSVDDGSSWVAQASVDAAAKAQCNKADDCGACVVSPYCGWCGPTEQCAPDQGASGCALPGDFVGQLSGTTCPAIVSATPTEGDATGGTVVDIDLSVAYFNTSMTCQWFFATGGGANPSSPLTRNPETGRWACTSPPRQGNSPAATLRIFHGARAYSPAIEFFLYYDCASFSGDCSACVSAPSECGYCLEEGTCGVASLCNGTVTGVGSGVGDGCPEVLGVEPDTVLPGGGDQLTVTGRLFVESPPGGAGYAVAFVSTSGNGGGGGRRLMQGDSSVVWANGTEVTWVSQTELRVNAPARNAEGITEMIVYLNGRRFSAVDGTLIYAEPDAVVDEPLSSGLVAAIAVVCLLLCCFGVAIGLYCYRAARHKKRFQPPRLTESKEHAIVFGRQREHEGINNEAYLAAIEPVVRLVYSPDPTIMHFLCDATAATEADIISKSLAILFEREGVTVRQMKALISREIANSISEATLFRTNSFATKIFKTYSKMAGVAYVRETLGHVLNYNMQTHGEEGLAISREAVADTEEVLSKFSLLTVCQEVFVAILQSEDRIPVSFRQIFHHVRAEIEAKYPIRSEDLAAVMIDEMATHLDGTQDAFENGDARFQNVLALQEQLTDNLDELAIQLPTVEEAMDMFAYNVRYLAKQLDRMLESFDSLQGALNANADAATRLIAEHRRKQNSIAVGGFLFLRFLVPAITAPEAYLLVKDLPTVHQRKMLVLVGKVLQNLSNGLNFGGKESHMIQLNDFIDSNRDSVRELFDTLSADPGDALSPSYHIPDSFHATAMIEVYKHMDTMLDLKILPAIDEALAATEDPTERARLKQCLMTLVTTMEEVRVNVEGVQAPSTRSISSIFGRRSTKDAYNPLNPLERSRHQRTDSTGSFGALLSVDNGADIEMDAM